MESRAKILSIIENVQIDILEEQAKLKEVKKEFLDLQTEKIQVIYNYEQYNGSSPEYKIAKKRKYEIETKLPILEKCIEDLKNTVKEHQNYLIQLLEKLNELEKNLTVNSRYKHTDISVFKSKNDGGDIKQAPIANQTLVTKP